MNFYIIIRGPASVGKSTVATKLSKDFNGKHISFDEILRKHKLDVVSGKCISAENFIKGNEMVIPGAIKELNNGKIVIFDGCFYYRQQIKDLIKHLHYPHFIFTLKSTKQICIYRDKQRPKLTRIGEDSINAVHKLVSKLDYGTIINTDNKTVEQTIKEIVKNLPKKTGDGSQNEANLTK
ncbi:hypothetical protein KKG58_03585 [Patescibacteria group bacterium]|nr:hypothetical protein [Patescibacteria group bacterium]